MEEKNKKLLVDLYECEADIIISRILEVFGRIRLEKIYDKSIECMCDIYIFYKDVELFGEIIPLNISPVEEYANGLLHGLRIMTLFRNWNIEQQSIFLQIQRGEFKGEFPDFMNDYLNLFKN